MNSFRTAILLAVFAAGCVRWSAPSFNNPGDPLAACGGSCPDGLACVDGTCSRCPASETACGGLCVDLTANPYNCGACGSICPSGTCRAGTCLPCEGALTGCNAACVDLSTDPANCGACGHACGAGASCSGGQCVCGAGEAMCGGACVNKAIDWQNCGTCGNVCAAGACTNGACHDCDGGRTACDGVCADLLRDADNCNACGHKCTGELSACVGGDCVCPDAGVMCSGHCAVLASDPNNCGQCGKTCASGGICVNSQCGCPGGGQVCSGRCIDTQRDTNNCGGCGIVCPGTCTSGVCTATLYKSDSVRQQLALDDGNVYFVADGGLLSIPKSGGTATTLVSDTMGLQAMVVDSGTIYWAAAPTNSPASSSGLILSVPVTGGTPTTLAANQNDPTALAVDATTVYWGSNYCTFPPNCPMIYGEFWSVPRTGGSPTQLQAAGTSGWVYGMTVDATNLYWSAQGEVGFLTKGTMVTNGVSTGYDALMGLVVDATNLYWLNANEGAVYTTPIGGTTGTALYTGTPGTITFGNSLAADATNLYWTTQINSGGGQVVRMPKSGGTPIPLASSSTTIPTGIAVDEHFVYWLDGEGLKMVSK